MLLCLQHAHTAYLYTLPFANDPLQAVCITTRQACCTAVLRVAASCQSF
jgi:hypothetical protein